MGAEKEKQMWIGLIGVRSLPESEILQEVTGAYVNVVTWASDRTEFQNKAHELMNYLHVMLVTIEDPEPLRNRGNIEDFDVDIREIAAQVERNPDAIMYGKFHTWTDKGV